MRRRYPNSLRSSKTTAKSTSDNAITKALTPKPISSEMARIIVQLDVAQRLLGTYRVPLSARARVNEVGAFTQTKSAALWSDPQKPTRCTLDKCALSRPFGP